MVNQQTLEGNWNEVKGGIRQRWGQLTNDDLSSFNGNVEQLVGLIQRKTGEARERIEQYLDQLTSDSSESMSRAAAGAREYAQHAAENFQHTYEEMSNRVRAGYGEAEDMIRQRPTESVLVAFGAGLIAGVIVGMVSRR